MTVVWSQPPNFPRMFGYDSSVSSWKTYMPIWRAVQWSLAVLRHQFLDREAEVLRGLLEDQLRRDRPGLVLAEQVGQDLGGPIDREGSWVRLAKADTLISAPSSTRMLSVMLVAMNSSTSPGMRWVSNSAFFTEDRQPGLEVGRLDVGHEPLLEPAAQVLDVDLVGWPVGREDDLAVGLVQVVEGVEELLDRLLLALEELHVVDQQHVDVPVAALEGVAAGRVHRVDELVEEGLGGHVPHLVGGVVPWT